MRYAVVVAVAVAGTALAETPDEHVVRLLHEGEYTEVESIAKQAVAQRTRANGPDHPNVVTCRDNQAAMLAEHDDGQGVTKSSAAEKSGPQKKPSPTAEPVPGYRYRVIQGFHVLIKEVVLEHDSDARYQRTPLEVLEMELKLISGLLPSQPLTLLRTVPIWVEWKQPGHPGAVAVYHGGPTDRTRLRNVVFVFENLEQRAKSNAIEIVDMESLTEEHQPAVDSGRCVLLHELAHAVHHHLIDYDNPHVKAAYRQAIERGLYRDCYASTNEMEYFAELSCAYFDRLDYEPRSQDELRRYDPIGYQMMELTWGTPERINATRDVEARRAYGKLRTQTRLMVQNGKVEEARGVLGEFLSCFRNTRTAEMAKQQFDELVAARAKDAKSPK